MTGPPARRIAAQVSRSPHFGSMRDQRFARGRRQRPPAAAGRCANSSVRKPGDVVVEPRGGARQRARVARGANVVDQRRIRGLRRQARAPSQCLQRRGDPRQDARDIGVDDAARQHRADRHDEAREQEDEQRQHQQPPRAIARGAGCAAARGAAPPAAVALASAAVAAAAAPRRIGSAPRSAAVYFATQALKRWFSLSRFSSQNLSLMTAPTGDVLRRGREVRQHALVDQRRRGLGRHAVGDLRRQVLLVLRIVDEHAGTSRPRPCSACPS